MKVKKKFNDFKFWCKQNKKKIIIVSISCASAVCGYKIFKCKKGNVESIWKPMQDASVEIFTFDKIGTETVLTDSVKKMIEDSGEPLEFGFDEVNQICMILGK